MVFYIASSRTPKSRVRIGALNARARKIKRAGRKERIFCTFFPHDISADTGNLTPNRTGFCTAKSLQSKKRSGFSRDKHNIPLPAMPFFVACFQKPRFRTTQKHLQYPAPPRQEECSLAFFPHDISADAGNLTPNRAGFCTAKSCKAKSDPGFPAMLPAARGGICRA